MVSESDELIELLKIDEDCTDSRTVNRDDRKTQQLTQLTKERFCFP